MYIVHVEVTHVGALPGTGAYVPELDEHRRLLEEARPESKKLRYEHHFLRGDVATEILRFAMLREVDRIIMGTHGRTGLIARLTGSVAAAICRKATCDVETVATNGQTGNRQRTVVAA